MSRSAAEADEPLRGMGGWACDVGGRPVAPDGIDRSQTRIDGSNDPTGAVNWRIPGPLLPHR